MTLPPAPLDDAQVALAVRHLSARDRDLAGIARRLGPPPLWARSPGFATLVHIILEQQVSLASARAAFGRLALALGEVSPEGCLALSDGELRAIGFSRQKARYARALAQAILSGELDLAAVSGLGDDDARAALVRIPGIGPWTADIYLLMALRRPDVLPRGDLALLSALKDVKRLPERPTHAGFVAVAEGWRPYRAVAARMLWQHYLSAPRPRSSAAAD